MEPSRPRRRSALTAPLLAALGTGTLAGCGGEEPAETGESGESAGRLLRADVERVDPGPAADAGPLAVPFTARLLGAVDRAEANLVCSPLSAQIALTMAALGAEGTTRSQLEAALGADVETLAEGANALTAALAEVGADQRAGRSDGDPEPDTAALADGVWVSERLEVREDYLTALARNLGAGVHTAEFADEPGREQARADINGFVEDATDALITELVPQGTLTADTVLVLVNALHLAGSWDLPLGEPDSESTFTRADGSTVTTGLMSGTAHAWYEDALCRATWLRTAGDLGLALVQPVVDVPAVLDAWAGAAGDRTAGLGALLAGLTQSPPAVVDLRFPAFTITTSVELGPVLGALGITDAFSADADFTGITAEGEVALSEVLHKAVISVDEKGMEAAAATAAIVVTKAGPLGERHELVLDRPFLYIACHPASGTPLVLGWVGDPTTGGA